MKKIVHITFLISLLAAEKIIAQPNSTLKGRIWHNKRGAMKQMKLTVDGAAVVTDNDGFFRVAVPTNRSSVRVLLSTNTYSVIYPLGGEVLLPADKSRAVDVVIGSPKENEYIQQYITINRTINNNTTFSAAKIDSLKTQLDSLKSWLIQMNYTEADLRTARELQEGKDRFYPEIATTIKDYKIKALNLCTAFQYVSNYAFERQDAFYQLKDAIENYNKAFEKYYQQQMNYGRYIDQYWQDDSLKKEYDVITNLALIQIHDQVIFKMQEQVDQIRSYLFRRKKNEAFKNSIKQRIEERTNQLLPLLKLLDETSTPYLLTLSG